jgi:hypothetical protein
MRKTWRRRLCLIVILLSFPASRVVQAQKFYPDDPLKAEPPPYPTYEPQARALSEVLELAGNTLGSPGERHPPDAVIPAGGINTLGEVLDGPWFVNRHATQRLSREALIRGPRTGQAPMEDGTWQVLEVKPYGFRPGILIGDARKRVYVLVFDRPDAPEMSTGAQVVSSHIAHAIGYHMPESYIVTFPRGRLVLAEGAEIVSSAGNARALTEEDVDGFLRGVARTGPDRYRAVAIYASPPEVNRILGPYQVYSTRSDDPNDIVPHEHRRDLRGLFVIASWIDWATARAIATMDAVIDDGVAPPHVRHHLVDFVSSLGAGGDGPKRAWDGNDPLFDGRAALKNLVGFGVWSPRWMRARYPDIRGVGRFESQTFDPPRWASIERLAPFENRLPDDDFWGAKQVMAFSDEDIRALVSTGEYTDPTAAEWIAQSLIARRDKIGRHYFATVLPLDAFRLENGRLTFDDLSGKYRVTDSPRTYSARWLRLVNDPGELVPLQATESLQMPAVVDRAAPGSFHAVRIADAAQDPERNVTVYVRTGAGGGHEVVGIERGWPGKVLADPRRDVDIGVRRFAVLTDEQQQLYATYAKANSEARGRQMTAEEHFEAQTVSERTTYEAVTHALLNSKLTDQSGTSLGRPIDIIAAIERVAGHDYGRGGDRQFRLFVALKPGAVDTLEQSVEFFFGHENTVYHVGYPHSFRQVGREPNLQISVSEDGFKADIDVDYRSSRMPQSLFNGHLRSANSDIRAGDNVARHNGRWAGMVAWWRRIFGDLPGDEQGPQDTLSLATQTEVPTPMPPDRSADDSPERLEDAVQEFLTDWLVRREWDEALTFLSDTAYACINIDDDARYEALDKNGTRAALRDTMTYVVDMIEKPENLTEAIDAVRPLKPDGRIAHAFDGEFSMRELDPAEVAAEYNCAQQQSPTPDRSYYGVAFRFKGRDAAALGLLWTQVAGQWKLLSYQVFEM